MISEKARKIILNILKSRLSKLRDSLKECQSDKNCSLKSYENIVEKCQQIEYAIDELENLK